MNLSKIPLRELISEIRRRNLEPPSPEDGVLSITETVAEVFKVDVQGMLGPSRQAPLAEARFAAWLILRDREFLPGEIARVYRRLDVGTIRHGCRKGKDLLMNNRHFAVKLKKALEAVSGKFT